MSDWTGSEKARKRQGNCLPPSRQPDRRPKITVPAGTELLVECIRRPGKPLRGRRGRLRWADGQVFHIDYDKSTCRLPDGRVIHIALQPNGKTACRADVDLSFDSWESENDGWVRFRYGKFFIDVLKDRLVRWDGGKYT
jgi:hypothetical protein